MSTTHSAPDKGTDRTDPFTATEPIRPVDAAALASMADPDALVEQGQLAYAVAHRTGVVTLADRELEYEATAVLYCTTDGRAVERHFPRGVETAPRACLVPERVLHTAGLDDQYAAELALHPETEA